MKTSHKILAAAFSIMIIICSCGKDKDTSDIYIPDINGSWVNQQSASEQLVFNNAPSNAATGTFTGFDNIDGTPVATLSGSFTHSKITFTLEYADVNTPHQTYSGTIAGATNPTMTLTSNGKQLNLKKQ